MSVNVGASNLTKRFIVLANVSGVAGTVGRAWIYAIYAVVIRMGGFAAVAGIQGM